MPLYFSATGCCRRKVSLMGFGVDTGKVGCPLARSAWLSYSNIQLVASEGSGAEGRRRRPAVAWRARLASAVARLPGHRCERLNRRRFKIPRKAKP